MEDRSKLQNIVIHGQNATARTHFSLFKYDAKINVYNFTSPCVDKNVGCVAVANT